MSYNDKPGIWSKFRRKNVKGERGAEREHAPHVELPHSVKVTRQRSRIGRDPSFPSFSTKAGLKQGDAQFASAMKRLRQSFTPSHPVSNSRLFAGRRALLEKIVSLLEDQHLHLVLYGDRGIGKTSLMRIVAELANDADYYVSYTSCGKDTRFDALIRGIAGRIPLLFHRDFDPTESVVEEGNTLESLFHAGEVSVSDATSVFENLHGTQFLFLLDEFDRVASSEVREQIAELIKNLSDRGATVQFVIAGVASNLTALFSHIPSIRRNLIGIPVDRLSDRETRNLVELGASRSGVKFSNKALDLLATWSRGLPYIAQLLALHASLVALRGGKQTVDIRDVEAAGDEAEEEIGLRLSDTARRVIQAEQKKNNLADLRTLAIAASEHADALPEAVLGRLDRTVRAELFKVAGGRTHFAEEASIPFILLVSRGGDDKDEPVDRVRLPR